MSIKQKIEFSDLDIKFHKELPTLMDVFSACTNKIINLLTPIHDKIYHFIAESISKNEKYYLKIISNNTISFNEESFNKNKAVKLTRINNHFTIKNIIRIIHIESEDFIEIEFGLYYDPTNEDYDIAEPFYYFCLKYNPKKLDINLKEENFYKTIENEFVNKYNILYDFIGKDNIEGDEIEEFIEIGIRQYDPEVINEASKDFIEKILSPILIALP